MQSGLTGEARARLDAYLDAVEARLTGAGHSREQRRGVVDDLEAQVLDMLAARSASPTASDVAAVIDQLDPPQAYGTMEAAIPKPAPAVARTPRIARMAIVGSVLVVIAVALGSGAAALGSFLAPRLPYVDSSGWPHEPRGVHPAYIDVPIEDGSTVRVPIPIPTEDREARVESHWSALIVLLPLMVVTGASAAAGTVLGWIAFFRIRRSRGMLTGAGLALFDGLLIPAIVVVLLLFLA